MQKVTQTRVRVIQSDAPRGLGRILAGLLVASSFYLVAQPSLASAAHDSVVVPANSEFVEHSAQLQERRDNSFRHQRQLNEATKVSPQGLDRQGLRRVLVDDGPLPHASERKRMSQEERYNLQRELREAARGANEARPMVSVPLQR